MKPSFAGLLLMPLLAFGADLTVVELKHRRADEVIPILRPLVSADTALTGVDYKLIVRGAPEDVARIHDALQLIDRAPRQLIVSVRYDAEAKQRDSDVGVSATVSNQGSQVTGHAGTTLATSSDSNVGRVRVLEGASAHIDAGQMVPTITAALISTRTGNYPGNRPSNSPGERAGVTGYSSDYVVTSSGFDVLPRINGEQVILEIAAQHERPNAANRSVESQRTTTTISGRLGEWIELGGVQTAGQSQTNIAGLGARHMLSTQSDDRVIAVKVELAQ